MPGNVLELFKGITSFFFDVDGVLTDGSLLLLDDGQMARTMNIKDGFALQLAIKKAYRIFVISGANCPAVKLRLEKLGVKEVYMGVQDKLALMEKIALEHTIPLEEILFMGDDIPDHEAMNLVGLPCCPADAVSDIRQLSKYISPESGGKGCVRDVIEKVLKLRGDWTLNSQIKSQ